MKSFHLMEKDFEYKRSFTITESDLTSDAIILHCEGIDTLSHVYLNGKKVADTDNMHRTWEWEVKKLLQPGENEIAVLFDSPLKYVAAENEKRPCWQTSDATPGFPHIRKTHCQFGWDWGPRLPDAGIWRNIELQCVTGGRLPSVTVLQNHLDGKVELKIVPELEIKGNV